MAQDPPETVDITRPPPPAEDPKALLNEANGASDSAWSSWLAFLLLLTYVVVTLAGVSHKALLLNNPVKLPIINADIPLVGFFQYAPALLLLVYLSLLIQHVILARKYRRFTEAIAPYERETGTEHPAREGVHSYVFAQVLAGPRPNRITKFMMQLIVYVTFSIIPIVTLLYFQVKFLPYHEVSVTYWHRFAVILGFAMLITAERRGAAVVAAETAAAVVTLGLGTALAVHDGITGAAWATALASVVGGAVIIVTAMHAPSGHVAVDQQQSAEYRPESAMQ